MHASISPKTNRPLQEKKNIVTLKLKIWIALIAVYIVWGSTYLAIRFMVESIPPYLATATRFLVAGLILYLWQRARGVPVPTHIEWRSAALVGLLMLLGGNGSLVWAEQRIPSGIAALFIGSSPLIMVLIDSLRPGGRNPGWLTWTGVLVGFGGIALLAAPWQSGSSQAVARLYAVGARKPSIRSVWQCCSLPPFSGPSARSTAATPFCPRRR